MVGIGFLGIVKIIEQICCVVVFGVSYVLVVMLLYVWFIQVGLIVYYCVVVDQGGLLVVLYNVFGCIGCDMQFEIVVELVSYFNIVGIKEVVGDIGWVQVLFVLCSLQFCVFSGDDGMVVCLIQVGIDGLILVGFNVFFGVYCWMCELVVVYDYEVIVLWDVCLYFFYDFCGVELNLILVKVLLCCIGIGYDLCLLLLLLLVVYYLVVDYFVGDIVVFEVFFSY